MTQTLNNPEPPEANPGELRRSLLARMKRLDQRLRRYLLADALLVIAASVTGFVFVSYALDRLLRLSLPTRVVLMIAALVGLGYLIHRRLILPWRHMPGPIAIAAMIDRITPPGSPPGSAPGAPGGRAAMVASVLELPDMLERESSMSAAMVHQAVFRNHETLAGMDFESHLNRRRLTGQVSATLAMVLLLAAWGLFDAGHAGLWLSRWMLGSTTPWPQRTYLELVGATDGVLVVPQGEAFVLRVRARRGSQAPRAPGGVTLSGRDEQGKTLRAAMTRFADNDFRHDMTGITQPWSITLRGGDDRLGPLRLEPRARPTIQTIALTSLGPIDEAPVHHDFTSGGGGTSGGGTSGGGRLAFLPGTKLRLELAGNVAVEAIRVAGDAGPGAALPGAGVLPTFERIDDRHFVASWVHDRAMRLRVSVIGRDTGFESTPLPLGFGLLEDQPPSVSMRAADVGSRVTARATVPLAIAVKDDYGLAALSLSLSRQGVTDSQTSPLGEPRQLFAAADTYPKQLSRDERVTLGERGLVPGDVVRAAALAVDMNTGVEPRQSQAELAWQVVDDQALLRELMQALQQHRAALRKVADDLQAHADALMVVTAGEGLPDLAMRHRALARAVAEHHRAIAALQLRMQLNDLGSVQVHDLLLKKVIDPLEALHTGQLQPQGQTLGGLSRRFDAAGLDTLIAAERRSVADLRAILRNMAQWDSFMDVLAQLDQVVNLQTSVRDAAKAIRRRLGEELSD